MGVVQNHKERNKETNGSQGRKIEKDKPLASWEFGFAPTGNEKKKKRIPYYFYFVLRNICVFVFEISKKGLKVHLIDSQLT